jgi:Kdo2-lipid IVA lauroyltransferase/acyltransferase
MAHRTLAIPRTLRRSLAYPLLAGGRASLAALPLRAAYALADAAAGGAFRLLPRERRRMAEHLALAFPGKTEAEREAIARESFRHFGRVFVEAARLPALSTDEVVRMVRVDDPAGTLERMRAGREGVIAVGAHLGNWELMAAHWARTGVPLKVVATRARDPRVNSLLVSLRASSGIETIQRDEGARPVLKALRDGKVLGLVIDQDMDVDGCFVPFFGRPAWTTRGPGVLHLASGAPVVPVFCTRGPDGCYDMRLEPPLPPAPRGLKGPERDAAIERVVAELTARIEAAIRRDPAQWVWWHRRWKTRPPAEPDASSLPD